MTKKKDICVFCEKELVLLEKELCDSCRSHLEVKYPNPKILKQKIKEYKKHLSYLTKFREGKK